MDLCSVDFYVERAKISRTFNHGAFWNKLNIYPSARLGKKIAWEFFFVCSQEKSPWEWRKKEKKKIKQRYQICGCLFIDLFETTLMQNFCGRLWGFSHTIFIQAREGCLFDHLFLSTLAFSLSLPQEIADWVLSFWARLSFPLHSLSHTHKKLPQWAQSSLLKTSQCNKTWSNIDSSRAFQICFHR